MKEEFLEHRLALREELIKMFDEEFGELYHLIDGEEYGWKETPMGDEVKQFIFDAIIPEVIKEIISSKYVENKHEFGEGYNYCIDDIKQKAKELYNINL